MVVIPENIIFTKAQEDRIKELVKALQSEPTEKETREWVGVGNLIEYQASNMTNNGGLALVILRNAQADGVSGNVRIPVGKTSISSIKVIFLNEVGSANLVVTAETSRINIDDLVNYGQLGDSDTDRVYSVTGSNTFWDAFIIDTSAYNSLTQLSAGDIVNLKITRKGADASDTYNVDLKVAGFLFTFAA